MKNRILLVICFISLVCSACYEDKGSYDYKNLTNVTIEGFRNKDGNVISVMKVTIGSDVYAKPELTILNEKTTRNFKYTWTFQKEVIGTDEILNWTSDKIADGSVILDIEDLDNGTHFTNSFSLTVGAPYEADGFLILSEKDGNPCISLLKGIYYDDESDYELLLGLYEKENGKLLPDDVFKIHEHFCSSDARGAQIMAVCQTDLVDINSYSFKEEMRADKMFSSAVPKIRDVIFMQWLDLVADEEGQLYQRRKTTNELFHSQKFLKEPVKFQGKILKDIRIIPDEFSSYRNFCLLYDNNEKRYLVISDYMGKNWSTDENITTVGKIEVASYEQNSWPEKFTPLDNMKGCEVIFTGYSRESGDYITNNFFSIIKKQDGYYYQKFSMTRLDTGDNTFQTSVADGEEGKAPALLGQVLNDKSVIKVLEYSEGAGSGSHPYAFISNGNALYLYDLANPADDLSFGKLIEFDSPITAIDPACPEGNFLGVGLENGEFYVLRMNQAKNHLGDKEYLVRWHVPAGELGRIKDIRYKTDGYGVMLSSN